MSEADSVLWRKCDHPHVARETHVAHYPRVGKKLCRNLHAAIRCDFHQYRRIGNGFITTIIRRFCGRRPLQFLAKLICRNNQKRLAAFGIWHDEHLPLVAEQRQPVLREARPSATLHLSYVASYEQHFIPPRQPKTSRLSMKSISPTKVMPDSSVYKGCTPSTTTIFLNESPIFLSPRVSCSNFSGFASLYAD